MSKPLTTTLPNRPGMEFWHRLALVAAHDYVADFGRESAVANFPSDPWQSWPDANRPDMECFYHELVVDSDLQQAKRLMGQDVAADVYAKAWHDAIENYDPTPDYIEG